jgi:hypothetical protein
MVTSADNKVFLSVPPQIWNDFRNTLLAMRSGHEEVIGFFFCTRHVLPNGSLRLLPRAWVVPSRECYDFQSSTGLELRQDFHCYLVHTYLSRGLDAVHIHTHPGLTTPSFSGVDDQHEAEYARFLARLPRQPLLVSGVFDEQLNHAKFRVWKAGACQPCDLVEFSTTWLGFREPDDGAYGELPRFHRQRVFGSGVQQTLARMTVGLIGCGGLGAAFAEQLARLGVRSWVLVDPDRLDESNLNRMPFATPTMARRRWSKVRYLKQVIRRAWPAEALIQHFVANVSDPRVEGPLSACDLLVVATDNHLSRMIAQEIALRYVRPLLSLGTLIDARQGNKELRFYCRVTHPPVHGGWCLMCASVIDPMIAAAEAAPQELADMVKDAGYVPDVQAPAVYWLNSVCASLGVQVIHGAISGFLDVSAGLDWTLELRDGRWFRLNHNTFPECLHCSPEGKWAQGEEHEC